MEQLVVSQAQVDAAQLLLDMEREDGREPDEALSAIANAQPVSQPANGFDAAAAPRPTNGHAHAGEAAYQSRTPAPAQPVEHDLPTGT